MLDRGKGGKEALTGTGTSGGDYAQPKVQWVWGD